MQVGRVRVRMRHRLMFVSMGVPDPGRQPQMDVRVMPAAISPAAPSWAHVAGSTNMNHAKSTPRNGEVENSSCERLAPNCCAPEM